MRNLKQKNTAHPTWQLLKDAKVISLPDAVLEVKVFSLPEATQRQMDAALRARRI